MRLCPAHGTIAKLCAFVAFCAHRPLSNVERVERLNGPSITQTLYCEKTPHQAKNSPRPELTAGNGLADRSFCRPAGWLAVELRFTRRKRGRCRSRRISARPWEVVPVVISRLFPAARFLLWPSVPV